MKKRIIFIITLVMLLITTSLGGTYFYKVIKNKYDNVDISLKNGDFADSIVSFVYAFDITSNDDIKLTKYFDIDDKEHKDVEEYVQAWATSYYSSIAGDQNIAYYIKNENATSTNTEDDLISLINTGKWKDKYQWYVTLRFDSNGNYISTCSDNTVTLSQWFEDTTISLDCTGINLKDDDLCEKLTELRNPTNLTAYIAVPNTLKYYGNLYETLTAYSAVYQDYCFIYLAIASLIVGLFMLLYPITVVKEVEPYRSLSKIKFLIIMTIDISILVGLGALIYELLTYELMGHLGELFISLGIPTFYTWFVHAFAWLAFLFVLTDVFFELKLIFHIGFKKFIKEYTVVGWLYQLILDFVHFDFKDNTNAFLIKLLLAVLLVIAATIVGFIISPYVGAGALVVFFVLFARYAKKYVSTIKTNYDHLHTYAQEISDGNFDEAQVQDVGIFNPLQETLSNVGDGFESAVQEEIKSQKMKNELISNVSHDLKTPLTNIITYVDLMKTEELNENLTNYVDVLDRNAQRLKKLIDDLFEISKVNSGDIKLEKNEIDLVALIKQIQIDFENQLNNKGLIVRFKSTLDKAMCNLDGEKTVRIFENLFNNVEKYALDNTRFYIDIDEEDGNVVVLFKNVSKSEITFDNEEITERFVQGDNSRSTGGSGLGLAIVKSFTEMQNGTFYVDHDGDLFKAIVKFPLIVQEETTVEETIEE